VSLQEKYKKLSSTEQIVLQIISIGYKGVSFKKISQFYLDFLTEKKINQRPLQMIEEKVELTNTIKDHYRTCRAFGYGLDNDDQVGRLRGGHVPINFLTVDAIIMKMDRDGMDPDSQLPVARTDHGDSGGPLICRTPKGIDKIVGVISYGATWEQDLDSLDPFSEVNVFSNLVYLKPWINAVKQQDHRPQGTSGEGLAYYHQVAASYEFVELEFKWQQTQQCIKDRSGRLAEGEREGKKILKDVANKKNNFFKQYQQGKISGLDARSYMKILFKRLEDVYGVCQMF
jgi:hypothetical protein